MSTKIEWTDETCNVTVGCSKCSPGCDNCYAERLAARWAKHPNPKIRAKYEGTVDAAGKWTGKINGPDFSAFKKLPKTPKRVFVGSMTDIFHDVVKIGSYSKTFLPRLFDILSSLPQHTFMLLTKRPEHMRQWIEFTLEACVDDVLPNLWLGVTVCNQAEADAKIPVLLQTPAAKRFISVEPMLGPVDLSRFICKSGFVHADECGTYGPECEQIPDPTPLPMRDPWVRALDWVICGGETGACARPMHPDWVRSLRDQCQATGTPFFFKGWGEYREATSDERERVIRNTSLFREDYCQVALTDGGLACRLMRRVGKRRAGRLLDGREWNEGPA